MKQTLLTLALAVICSMAFGQKIGVAKGNPGIIKGQKEISIIYKYDPMAVGKFSKEADYVKKKVADYNSSEAGRGDKWGKAWVADREARFEPKFEELFNDYAKDLGIKASRDFKDTKYTLIIHTHFTEPGFNVYVKKKPALINLNISIVETANPDKVLAKITLDKATGKTFGMGDFDTGVRIQESYAKAGKEFAKFLVKGKY